MTKTDGSALRWDDRGSDRLWETVLAASGVGVAIAFGGHALLGLPVWLTAPALPVCAALGAVAHTSAPRSVELVDAAGGGEVRVAYRVRRVVLPTDDRLVETVVHEGTDNAGYRRTSLWFTFGDNRRDFVVGGGHRSRAASEVDAAIASLGWSAAVVERWRPLDPDS